QRLGVSGDGVDLLAEIRLEQITQALVERQPGVAVIDSIQTLYSGELTAAPGSVSQVRERAAQLTRIAKPTGITLTLIGHATQEGTRPLLVEVQALVDTAHVPNPRRLSVGLESSRLAMLLAVLHRHAGIATYDQDVFVNAVGGVRIMEPAADLAVALAILSSMRD